VEGDPAPELLDRYLTGECSAESAASIRQWMAKDPAHTAQVDELREIRGVAANTPVWDTANAWWELKNVLGDELPGHRLSSPAHEPAISRPTATDGATRSPRAPAARPFGGGFVRSWRGVAAVSATAVAAIAVAVWGRSPARGGRDVPPATAYTTGNGQRANISLPDGSTVMLSVASHLEVPADYASGNRTLRLEGEALFTVAHRPGTPFRVVAGATTARVLGTSFVVRHYASDTMAVVAVRDGRVEVHSIALGAAQQMDIGVNGMSRVHDVDSSRFAFATGVVSFNGTPLRDAIPELARWYDADIRLGDNGLRNRRIVGEFAGGSLSDLIAILNLSFDNIRIVRDGRIITLYSK